MGNIVLHTGQCPRKSQSTWHCSHQLYTLHNSFPERERVTVCAQVCLSVCSVIRVIMHSCSIFILACRPDRMIIIHYTTILCFIETSLFLSVCLSLSHVCACARMYLPVKCYFFPSVRVFVTFSSISFTLSRVKPFSCSTVFYLFFNFFIAI